MADKDFIKEAVDNAFNAGIERKLKSIAHKRELFNHKNNLIRKKRKQERKNRRKGRC